jgi:hypothetical protein
MLDVGYSKLKQCTNEGGANMDDIFLTVTDAARILNRSGESVRNYERRGILPASKTARGIRLFKQSDVEALAERQRKVSLGFQPRKARSEDPQAA